MEQNRRLDQILSRAKGLFLAALLGVIAELAVLFVFALIAAKMGNFHSVKSVGVYVTALLGGILSGFIAAKKAGKNGLVNGAAAALCTGAMMWLVALVPTGAVGGASPIPAIVCVIGGPIGGLIGVNLSYR